MDKESRVTYGVIGVIILVLGTIAYTLQPTSLLSDKDKQDLINKKIKTTAQKPQQQSTSTKPMEEKLYTSAIITTNKGPIEISLESKTPLTVKNFATLASKGFYEGVRFHRVIKNFMIQTGDPLSKDVANQAMWGTGGPGYKFNDELRGDEQYPLGTVAMANAGPNTNGSQFFIVTANPGYPLPPSYTVFGHVTKGIETALLIQEVKTNAQDRPLEDIIIEKIEVK